MREVLPPFLGACLRHVHLRASEVLLHERRHLSMHTRQYLSAKPCAEAGYVRGSLSVYICGHLILVDRLPSHESIFVVVFLRKFEFQRTLRLYPEPSTVFHGNIQYIFVRSLEAQSALYR